jgi:hypothetical protein
VEKRFVSAFGLVIIFLILAAGCGSSYDNGSNNNGGGGSTSYAGQAQGVYSGTSSSGYSFSTIVLPNDKFYAIYGTTTGNFFNVYGMIAGQGKSGTDTITGSLTDYLFNGQTFADTLTATDVPGASISGTITENGMPITFNGTALATSSFNYNTAASISAISGTWNGSLLDGTATDVTINSNGTVSGSNLGCSFSGTVAADTSGKNFYDVSLTFGASPCLFPNQTATGVAVYYLLSDGVTHQLLVGGTLGNTAGTVFFAQR